MKNTYLTYSIFSLIFVAVLGTLLHFFYDWSNHNFIIGMFSPVNESVWEHLKLGFFSMVVFMLFEYKVLRPISKDYFTAKLIGILCMELFIVIVFYTYTFFTKHSILAVDISTYFISAFLYFIVSYLLMKKNVFNGRFEKLSLSILCVIAVFFAYFSYNAPKLKIFTPPKN